MSNSARMSEKAKGKQRAYLVNRETKLGMEMTGQAPVHSGPAKVLLGIRFVDGSPDMMLEMSPEETGGSLMSTMRLERLELANKQLRLIHSGRMLASHTPLSMLRSTRAMAANEEDEGRHEGLGRVSLSLPAGWLHDRPKEKVTTEDDSSIRWNRVWLHCAVTQAEAEGAGDRDSVGLGSETPQAYDRFTDAGLSSMDVQSIRALFRRVMFGANTTSSNDSSGVVNGSAVASAWPPDTAEAHRLESQWLDSITQPSIFEESPSGQVGALSTPLSRVFPFLSYLLPTTNHASPARATTQGLIFAFFFPFIAGLAVANEVLVRPPAFFDGEIWPELNRDAVEMYSTLEAGSEDDAEDAPDGEADLAQTSGGTTTLETNIQDDAPVVPPGQSAEPQVPDRRRNRPSRGQPRVFDTAMDPVPSLIFSPGMQTAIRAGLVLNLVTGFYLWLYAS